MWSIKEHDLHRSFQVEERIVLAAVVMFCVYAFDMRLLGNIVLGKKLCSLNILEEVKR